MALPNTVAEEPHVSREDEMLNKTDNKIPLTSLPAGTNSKSKTGNRRSRQPG